MDTALVPLFVLVPACLFASWSDVSRRVIPNWLCGVVALAGLGVAIWTGGLEALGWHALHMVIALLVGMVLFRFGMLGGGDAKFYAACAAWFTLSQAGSLLLMVSLCGLGLFAVWFAVRRAMRKPIRMKPQDNFDRLPYGIAIAAGTVIAMLSNGS